jgi:hypothetical protein
MQAVNQFLKGTGITKLPEVRYPNATRRIFGVISLIIYTYTSPIENKSWRIREEDA